MHFPANLKHFSEKNNAGLLEVTDMTGSKAPSGRFHPIKSSESRLEDFHASSSDETLGSVYIHSLIHLTCSGDGGVLCNEAFISGLRPICLQ